MTVKVRGELTDCPDCGSAHLGGRCGMTFAQRIGTVQLDRASLETADLKNYYDAEPIHEMFGEDAYEESLEDTDGIGVVKRDSSGRWMHKNRNTKEIEPVTEKQMDFMLGADDED